MAPRGRAAVVEPEPEETEFDGTVYADKEPTHTMEHFAIWLVDEVYEGELPKGMDLKSFQEGVRLGGTLRMIFQASDYWRDEREAYKADREVERKAAAVEKRAAAKAAAEAEEEEAAPKPKARGRVTTTSSSTTTKAPARRGKAAPAAEADEEAEAEEAPAPKPKAPARRGRAAAATAPF